MLGWGRRMPGAFEPGPILCIRYASRPPRSRGDAMFAAETDGFGCWRGRRTLEFRPAIIHLETRLVPNGSMMPPSGHVTDPVTVAAGIDTLSDQLGGNLAGRA